MGASSMLRRRRIVATIAGASLIGLGSSAAATTPPTDTSAADEPAAAAEPTPIELTITADAIEGLPSDLAAGLVAVTATGPDGPVELDFSRVEPGTDIAAFPEALMALMEGGPAPDFFLNNAGIIGGSGVTALDEGEYIVWADLSAEDAETPTLVTAPLTVGPGDDDAVVPPGDLNIKAGDYLFDLDVSVGGETATFTNTSDNQLHHVVLVDFGTNDPALIEEKLPELLAGDESTPPPDGVDMSQVNFEFGGSGVQGPGTAATFPAPAFEGGHTYVALCFISDLEGGMPHALQHQMFKVFTVDA